MMDYGWQNQGWGAGTWVAMMIIMVVFWGLLVAGVVYIVRHFTQMRHQSPYAHSGAIEALKMRFARGEIDEEEFQKRLKLLKDDQ